MYADDAQQSACAPLGKQREGVEEDVEQVGGQGEGPQGVVRPAAEEGLGDVFAEDDDDDGGEDGVDGKERGVGNAGQQGFEPGVEELGHQDAVDDKYGVVADKHGGDVAGRMAVEDAEKARGKAAVGLIDLVAQLAAGDKGYLHAAEEGGKQQAGDEEGNLGGTHYSWFMGLVPAAPEVYFAFGKVYFRLRRRFMGLVPAAPEVYKPILPCKIIKPFL